MGGMGFKCGQNTGRRAFDITGAEANIMVSVTAQR